MNPVTFNDVFERFLAVPVPKGQNRLAGTPYQYAPLFEAAVEPSGQKWGEGRSRELVLNNDGLLRLPFPVVRASIQPPEQFKVGSYIIAKLVIFQGPCPRDNNPCNWLWAELRFRGEPKNDKVYLLQVWFRALSVSEDGQPDGAINFEAGPSLFDAGRKFANLTKEMNQTRLLKISEHMMMLAAAFLFDVNNPSNHIARVSPDGPGKSPQWRAAREHYVILDRRHAANKAEVPEGAAVEHDTEGTLARISHTRRAHWRRLKSDKFKAAKGKLIWIKSTWVGPKVWRDMIGSTYTLLR